MERLLCWGHKNVLSEHRTTLEITKDRHLTKNGECILGIGIESPDFLLSSRLISLIQQGKQVDVHLKAGPYTDSFHGFGHKDLALTHPTDLVFRKSEFICNRTVLIRCTKASEDINRQLVKYLQDPAHYLEVEFRVSEGSPQTFHFLQVPTGWTHIFHTYLKQHELLNSEIRIQQDEHGNLIPLVRKGKDLETELRLVAETKGFDPNNLCFVDKEILSDFPMSRLTLTESLQDELPAYLLSLVPKSYDIIGSIIILDLNREEQADLVSHKHLIARRALSLHKETTSVFMKKGIISGVFRVRDLEFLDGLKLTQTLHKENNCRFLVDIEKTFFSPRLGHERNRIANFEAPVEIIDLNQRHFVLDMFAGVGPFSIQLAKNHPNCLVYGVDINLEAVELAHKNNALNHTEKQVVFIHDNIRDFLPPDSIKFSRFLMNLPEKNLEFLQEIPRFIAKSGALLHIYLFAVKENPCEDGAHQLKKKCLECGIQLEKILKFTTVKPYSPALETICIDAWISVPNEEGC